MPGISIETIERPMASMVADAKRDQRMIHLERLLAQYRRGLMTDEEYVTFVTLELSETL